MYDRSEYSMKTLKKQQHKKGYNGLISESARTIMQDSLLPFQLLIQTFLFGTEIVQSKQHTPA